MRGPDRLAALVFEPMTATQLSPDDTQALQARIRELARERNAVVLAHNYERPEVQDVADYVGALFIVYIILIFCNILISWVPRMPYNPTLRAVLDFITETTDPYLNLFRRFLPPVGGGGFAIDLSPMIGIIVLFVLQAVVVGLISG